MKKFLVICALLVSSSALFTACSNSEAKTYQCPMKCEGDKTYDKPGDCPLCKMPMEEVKK